MGWGKRMPYKSFAYYVGHEREGVWLASVIGRSKRGMASPSPDQGDILGPFPSEEAAENAAREYIDQREEQRHKPS